MQTKLTATMTRSPSGELDARLVFDAPSCGILGAAVQASILEEEGDTCVIEYSVDETGVVVEVLSTRDYDTVVDKFEEFVDDMFDGDVEPCEGIDMSMHTEPGKAIIEVTYPMGCVELARYITDTEFVSLPSNEELAATA
jgi:hypothetical protein